MSRKLRGAKWDALKALKQEIGEREFYRFIDCIYAGDIGPYQASLRITQHTGIRVDHPRIVEIVNRDYPQREGFPI